VASNKVDTLSIEEALPEASEKQIQRASALADDKSKYKKKYHFKESISTNLENITQSIREFFSFGWIMQPIPVAVKSGVVAFLVILIVSTTFIYYQGSKEIVVQMNVMGNTRGASERGIPGEKLIPKDINEGDTLYSGDFFQINFEIDQDAYLYVLFHGSTKNLQQKHPDPQVKVHQKTKAKTKYIIPQTEGKLYRLDENTGTETIFILASSKPINNLQEIIDDASGLAKEEIIEMIKTKNKRITVETRSFEHK
jgi:hypothetical protein